MILKKSKSKASPAAQAPAERAEKTVAKQPKESARASAPFQSRLNKERLSNVLLAPHMSEKSARVSAEANQFVFRVRGDATKGDVKAAVEMMFEVKVDGVQVMNQPGKKRRFGRIAGRRSGYRKAYVRLAAGQTIDFAGTAK